MGSRMERYNRDSFKKRDNINKSRTDKNQDLYSNLYTNSTYTEFADINDKNVVELTALEKSYRTREGYQKIKEYQSVIQPIKEQQDLEKFESLYPQDENKVYDINSILQEAKKNRDKEDELESKRKLRSTQYNILANLDLEQLEKYREEKRNRQNSDKNEEEEIKELINTITSRALRENIDEEVEKDLMSDLMPKSLDETIVKDTKSEDLVKEEKETDSLGLNNIDKSFYTKSMDLTDADFEDDDDEDEEFLDDDSKGVPVVVKVILFIVLIAIMTTIIYFIIQNI